MCLCKHTFFPDLLCIKVNRLPYLFILRFTPSPFQLQFACCCYIDQTSSVLHLSLCHPFEFNKTLNIHKNKTLNSYAIANFRQGSTPWQFLSKHDLVLWPGFESRFLVFCLKADNIELCNLKKGGWMVQDLMEKQDTFELHHSWVPAFPLLLLAV